ncbi:permease [Leminorella grimontii]|uniref:Permease n=1 Tax=Leminorella grimontii TaxID=82981 RepID=A0AAV5MX35_9GAMM|nr:permease [Leminorella grimontii]GKX57805.1 permease [Leminorella grimontii]VFS59428.1 putative chloramphenical resistance permease RarD [Leminorella grimontii]
MKSGAALAVFSFVLWGITPLYYRLLPGAYPLEMLAQRVLWSVPLLLLVRPLFSHRTRWKEAWRDKRSILFCLLATAIMAVSWCTFTYALTHGQVLAASLGYFINPLCSVLLGTLFLRERMSLPQKLAVGFAAAGVAYQLIQYGQLPALALIMGSAFALYGLARKFIRFDIITALTIETLWLVPLALLITLLLPIYGESQLANADLQTYVYYALTAPVTLLPLMFFAAAVRRTTLITVGLAQYIEPTLQFLLAIFLFNEAFDSVKGVSFGLIWIGLLFCVSGMFSQWVRQWKSKRLAALR